MTPEPPPNDACLFLDVDGTLIDIAPTPEAVDVPASLVRDLDRAAERFGGAVALVSGRSIADLDGLFAPVRLRASGVHGAEVRFDPDQAELERRVSALPETMWRDLVALTDTFPGTRAENKSLSFAVHYRASPGCGPELRTALERFLAERVDLGLGIMPGHCVFELKPRGVDKGSAIRALMGRSPFAGRRPIFIGDDVTDAPGFTAARSAGGWGYAVGRAFPDIAGMFEDPAAVRGWLAAIGRKEAKTA